MNLESLENFDVEDVNYFGKNIYFGKRVMGISGNLTRHLALKYLIDWIKKIII